MPIEEAKYNTVSGRSAGMHLYCTKMHGVACRCSTTRQGCRRFHANQSCPAWRPAASVLPAHNRADTAAHPVPPALPCPALPAPQGRDSLFDNVAGCGVDPRSIAQRIMEIRTQLSEEFIQELQAITEENSLLLR